MWLTEKERKQTANAQDAAFASPVPTQIVSNGEYNPLPQTEQQKQVEGRIKELADHYAHKLNMDRRSFELNFENNLLLHDPQITRELRARQQTYIDSALRVTMTTVHGWPWYRRLWNNAIAMLGPIL